MSLKTLEDLRKAGITISLRDRWMLLINFGIKDLSGYVSVINGAEFIEKFGKKEARNFEYTSEYLSKINKELCNKGFKVIQINNSNDSKERVQEKINKKLEELSN